jgi:hypothetical protein
MSRAVMDLVKARGAELTWLDLAGVEVSDVDLAMLPEQSKLTSIDLTNASGTFTIEGITQLSALTCLSELKLPGRWTRADIGKISLRLPNTSLNYFEAE